MLTGQMNGMQIFLPSLILGSISSLMIKIFGFLNFYELETAPVLPPSPLRRKEGYTG